VNFFGGFIISSGVYWILCKLSPIPATSTYWLEVDEDSQGRSGSLVYETDGYDPENGYGHPHDEIKGTPKLD
jgi:nucleobase:cation symporter-1, NCS1 family